MTMTSFAELKRRLLAQTNNPILHNKYLLFVLLFVSLAQLFVYNLATEYDLILMFCLVSAIVLHYSKNMLIVLASGLGVTKLVEYGYILKNKE